ncbi:MAG: hypothetical protein WBX15_08030 [Thermoanaerobaculia bacterium]
MLNTKTIRPTESPEQPDPLSRLIDVLHREGYETLQNEEEWKMYGERTYRRKERVLFAEGDTVFVFIDFPELTEKVVAQAVEGIANVYRARGGKEKALSIFQSTTVYVCLVVRSGAPHTTSLGRYVKSIGGAVLIPVVINSEINEVVYPAVEERLGPIRPRIQYLQWVLGELREPVSIHQQTVKTFYISAAIVGVIVIAIILAMI